jgi:hypothetical protein
MADLRVEGFRGLWGVGGKCSRCHWLRWDRIKKRVSGNGELGRFVCKFKDEEGDGCWYSREPGGENA